MRNAFEHPGQGSLVARIRGRRLPLWTVPAALLALCAISFGVMASKLGFYWDDWTLAWSIHFLGPAGFKEAFAGDRPLLAPIYVLTTSLLGKAPLNWQIFAVFTRWLAGVAVWWLLRGLWPDRPVQTAAAALLFVVYPGFKQGPIAITYGNAFLITSLYFVSLGMMVWAARARLHKSPCFWPLYAGSLLLCAYSVFTSEYYFGLELLRPVFLWLVSPPSHLTPDPNKPDARAPRLPSTVYRLLALWLPYLLIDLAFLTWRISNATPRAAITLFAALRESPVAALAGLGRTALEDIFQSSALAWAQTLDFSALPAYDTNVVLKYLLIAGSVAILSALYLAALHISTSSQQIAPGGPSKQDDFSPRPSASLRVPSNPRPPRSSAFIRAPSNSHPPRSSASIHVLSNFSLQTILIGLYALLIAGIPFWPTDLRIELFFPWDRFTLPMMFGASLLLVGLFEAVTVVGAGLRLAPTSPVSTSRRPWLSILLVSIFAGLAAGMHYQNALAFRKDWLAQRDFFWQLAWRAPALQPGTIILTSEMPFPYDWDNSLTTTVNWTYAPDFDQDTLPYLLYNAESRLSRGLPDLEKDMQIDEFLRVVPFKGSTSQTVLVFYRPPGRCVKVIDPQIDQYLPDKPRFFREIYTLSRPELILPDVQPPATPPLQFFGPEPTHDWCYFYEKADLARQQGDWEEVAALGDQAFEQKNKEFFRRSAPELVPFIEGYARTGRWPRAYELTQEAYNAWGNMRHTLCATWRRVYQAGPLDDQGQATYEQVQQTLQCQAP